MRLQKNALLHLQQTETNINIPLDDLMFSYVLIATKNILVSSLLDAQPHPASC